MYKTIAKVFIAITMFIVVAIGVAIGVTTMFNKVLVDYLTERTDSMAAEVGLVRYEDGYVYMADPNYIAYVSDDGTVEVYEFAAMAEG